MVSVENGNQFPAFLSQIVQLLVKRIGIKVASHPESIGKSGDDNLLGLMGSDRFIYDSTTGRLFFDANGTGISEAIQVAQLSRDLALTH